MKVIYAKDGTEVSMTKQVFAYRRATAYTRGVMGAEFVAQFTFEQDAYNQGKLDNSTLKENHRENL